MERKIIALGHTGIGAALARRLDCKLDAAVLAPRLGSTSYLDRAPATQLRVKRLGSAETI